MKIVEFANSVDPDNEPPHLDLHCLPSGLKFSMRYSLNEIHEISRSNICRLHLSLSLSLALSLSLCYSWVNKLVGALTFFLVPHSVFIRLKKIIYYIQSTLVISTSVISNNRLSRRENLTLILT